MMGMGSLGGNDVKNVNSGLNGANPSLVGNGPTGGSSSTGGAPFGGMGMGQGSMVNGIRGAMINTNSVGMNGRAGMPSMVRDQSMNHQQQDLGNQMLNGLGAINGFHSLQFDWKPSP